MQRPEDQPETDLSEVADEPPEQSIEAEQQVVGEDEPDVGGTVPPDRSQSAHAEGAEDDSDPDDAPGPDRLL